MKLIPLSTLALLLTFAPRAQALVIMLDQCATSVASYHVNLANNEGIGLERKPHFAASVLDADGKVVANYDLVERREGSIRFGRTHYIDLETRGQNFDLAYPSTNERNTEIKAVLPTGEIVNDEYAQCASNTN
jgi:hypothetical protein